jgi:hypothetical protein
MDSKLSALAAKKLLSEYAYLQSDDQLKRELIDTYKKDFLKKVSEKRPDINQTDPNKEGSKEVPQLEEDPIEVKNKKTSDKIRKIYRSIVKLTHPDKTKDEKLIEVYVNATKAHDENNLLELFLICNDLKIEVELESEDFELLKEIIDQKRNHLKSLEGSFIWMYINATTEEEKDKLIDIYINRYFK